MRRFVVAWLACAAASSVPRAAGALDPAVEVDPWALPASADAYLSIEGPGVPRHLDGVVLLGVSYGYGLSPVLRVPLHEGGSDIGTAVVDRWTLYSAGVVGLWDRLQLGIALPTALDERSEPFGDPRSRAAMPLDDGAGIGDLGLGAKWLFFDADHTSAALALDFSLPTGRPEALEGEAGVVIAPRLVGGLRFGRFEGAASVGARLRTKEGLLADGQPLGHQILAGLGARVRVADWLSIAAEVAARIAPDPWELDYGSVVEAGAGVVAELGGGLACLAGVTSGFGSDAWGSPLVRAHLALRWAPRFGLGDTDSDGILDRDDSCPGEPENRDGWEDSDGCPEREDDRDGDGVGDEFDACIDDPEDADGYEDNDGCPDLDHDEDGIPEGVDACLDRREDFDAFADEDGCPDLDNDGDGLADAVDLCPDEAESFDGVDDQDGCPELPPGGGESPVPGAPEPEMEDQ